MKKERKKAKKDQLATSLTEANSLSQHISGDLTVDGQIHSTGNQTAEGKIRSKGEGGIGAVNPNDEDASAYLGFFENTARIRLRGDGNGGADGPFQIQGRGDSVRMSIEENGTSINGTLDVEKKVTAPEFSGDLSGNAGLATRLQTPRIISLTGGATGSTTFDGSANVIINATVEPSGHHHTIDQVEDLQTELNKIVQTFGQGTNHGTVTIGNFCVQWGLISLAVTANNTGTFTVNFSKRFSPNPAMVAGSVIGSPQNLRVSTPAVSSGGAQISLNSTVSTTARAFWIAVGIVT